MLTLSNNLFFLFQTCNLDRATACVGCVLAFFVAEATLVFADQGFGATDSFEALRQRYFIFAQCCDIFGPQLASPFFGGIAVMSGFMLNEWQTLENALAPRGYRQPPTGRANSP